MPRSSRTAVVIVHTSPGWRPVSVNSIPKDIESAKFYSRKQPLYAALAIVEAYNKARLGTEFDGTWAMAIVAVGQGGVLNALRRASMSGAVLKPAAKAAS